MNIAKRYEHIGRVGRWALVAVVLLLGTAMTFGTRFWEKPISRERAIPAEATYQSCRGIYRRHGGLNEILVRFSDLEQQAIDSACATESLYNAVRALEPGTRVSLLLHPNSATILELRVGETVLLDFDRAAQALGREMSGFTVLGVLAYLGALGLAIPEALRRKWNWAFRKKWR